MPLDPSVAADLANSLLQAQADHAQRRSLVHDRPDMSYDDAYAVQHAWAEARLKAGARLRGYKVGLSAPALQRACAIDEPAYGHLFDDTFFDDGDLPAARFFEPRAETEIAFVLKNDLSGPDCSLADVLAATDFVAPAIEIVDTRFLLKDPATGAARGTVDLLADNTSAAAIVLGERTFPPEAIDLRWTPAILYRNDLIEASGVSGAILDHPGNGLAWLAKALHRRGERLKAGQVVMSGSFITPVPAVPGDDFVADYGTLGTIRFRFN